MRLWVVRPVSGDQENLPVAKGRASSDPRQNPLRASAPKLEVRRPPQGPEAVKYLDLGLRRRMEI